jgi:AraC-like DNA-binding protein
VPLFLKDTDAVLPLHQPLVLLAITEERGIDTAAVLRGTGVAAEMLANPEARISYVQLGELVDNALRLSGDPALGIECGKRMHIGHLGILGTALLGQPDLRAALEVVLKYHGLLAPAWQITLERNAQHAVLSATPTICIRHVTFAIEVLFGCLRTIGEFLLGEPLPFLGLECAVPAPPHAARYAEISGAPVRFDAERHVTWFDAALLDRRLAFADVLTARAAERQCAANLSIRLLRGSVEQVRRLLRDAGSQPPSLTQLARLLCTSPRQLRRELQSEGTSYRRLLDEVRKERALECMAGSSMTVDALARELGFQDARNFRRRFKLWTGCTPIEFRQARESLG